MGKRLARGLVLSAALAGALGAAGRADGPAAILKGASPRLVCVQSVLPAGALPSRVERARFSNTGFFVSDRGEVLTSLLGLAGCPDVRVICPDGRQSAATVASVDQPSGLALLRTDLSETAFFEPASAPPAPGGWALLAYVRARDEGAAVVLSPALVSRHDAALRLNGVAWEGLTAMSANVWPGCAGAPVMDLEGRLAGAVLGVSRAAGDPKGEPECLVLPVERLAAIVARLRQGESRRLGWLGVTLMAGPERREGVRVSAVLKDSPAQEAGLKAGDVILQIDEHTVEGAAVVARYVVEAGPGRTVSLKVLRGDRILTIPVEVGSRPLLICGGLRDHEEDLPRLRVWRSLEGLSLPGGHRESGLTELLRENQRLRGRIRELERRLQQAASAPD